MERRIVPLETERDYAPIQRDELSDIVGGFACQQECRFKRPKQDRHHLIYGRHDAETLAHRSSSEFIIRMCRCKHEQVHATWERSEEV